jgi:hypothetical protein
VPKQVQVRAVRVEGGGGGELDPRVGGQLGGLAQAAEDVPEHHPVQTGDGDGAGKTHPLRRCAVLVGHRQADGGEPGQRAGPHHRARDVLDQPAFGLAQPRADLARSHARAVPVGRVEHLRRDEGERAAQVVVAEHRTELAPLPLHRRRVPRAHAVAQFVTVPPGGEPAFGRRARDGRRRTGFAVVVHGAALGHEPRTHRTVHSGPDQLIKLDGARLGRGDDRPLRLDQLGQQVSQQRIGGAAAA